MTPALYELSTAGYTVVEGALDAERTAALRADLDAMLAADEAEWGAERLESMGQHGALRNLCDAAPSFARLVSDCPVRALVEALVGADPLLHSYDGLVMLPGTGRFPWDFHTDVMPLAGLAFPADRTPGINCLFYLDDVTPENGATWIVPASHKSAVARPAPEDLAALAFQAAGRAGDALVFDARLWHCAGHNSTARPRRLIKMLFCGSWLQPQMDYARAVRPEVMARLDPRAARLLGAGVSPPDTVRELRRRLARQGPP